MESVESDQYFESYEDLTVHELMLKDGPRNEAYRRAIFDNASQIKGKVVLDVGAGTGILSVFCAQAGASKVYSVEASNIYRIAEEVAKENGFESTIQVINARIEDVILPEKVDIIVSEWMGFYLLHECMLDSVIAARDKFLKPGGLIFPESATLYSAPCSLPSMFEEWGTISGVSMHHFASKLRRDSSRQPTAIQVVPEHVLSEPEVLTWIDLREVALEDVRSIRVEHVAVANKAAKYQGICLWFSCTFPSLDTEPVVLSTAPEDPLTHWKQTAIVFPDGEAVEEGVPMAYELRLARCTAGNRRYDIEVEMLEAEEVQHPEYCACHLTKCILVRAVLDKYEKDSLGNK